jgi:hypothetical protein
MTILRWKLQAKRNENNAARPKSWVTMEAGNDCILMGIAFAALAGQHAETAGGPLYCIRCGQDCVEHHFGNVRQSAGHGAATSTVAKLAQMASTARRFGSVSARSNAAGSPLEPTASRNVPDMRDHMPTQAEKTREAVAVFW